MHKGSKVYFPNLNALRCIAALLVVVHHIEQIKSTLGLTSNWKIPFIQHAGKLGVVLFFVLSGFLITYLLLLEIEVKKTISIRDFYIRRILRIWPLYFLIILSALFIFPNIHFLTLPGLEKDIVWSNLMLKLFLFIFFLPNLVLTQFGVIPFASQTWSIGVEEQFYLFWPVLTKYVRKKVVFIILVITGYISIGFILRYFSSNDNISSLYKFWASTPVDCMAIGALFSVICYNKHSIYPLLKKIIFNRFLQFSVFILVTILIATGFYFRYFNFEIYSVLFGIIIANLALNKKCIINLELKPLNYLGKISYGLYMYHPIVIVLAIKVLYSFYYTADFYLYPACIVLTILLASLSYHFFEKTFLSLKLKFSTLISGDNAVKEDTGTAVRKKEVAVL